MLQYIFKTQLIIMNCYFIHLLLRDWLSAHSDQSNSQSEPDRTGSAQLVLIDGRRHCGEEVALRNKAVTGNKWCETKTRL